MTQADKCLGGECSVDDVSELLVQIRVQIKALKESTAALEQLEGELSGKNTGVATDQVNKQTKHTAPVGWQRVQSVDKRRPREPLRLTFAAASLTHPAQVKALIKAVLLALNVDPVRF